MHDPELGRVLDAITAERIGPYEASCGGDRATALRLYVWNMEVSAAMWGLLHVLEVAYRNAAHRELTVLFGRPDWWSSPSVGLHPVGGRMVSEAARDLARSRKPATPSRMVAELRFGFWVSLLGKGNDYETRLWRPALHRAFPGYRGLRAPLHRELDLARLLRNRIAHLEPIHRRHLAADRITLLRLIGMVSPAIERFARRHDRLPDVLARHDDVRAGRAVASF